MRESCRIKKCDRWTPNQQAPKCAKRAALFVLTMYAHGQRHLTCAVRSWKSAQPGAPHHLLRGRVLRGTLIFQVTGLSHSSGQLAKYPVGVEKVTSIGRGRFSRSMLEESIHTCSV